MEGMYEYDWPYYIPIETQTHDDDYNYYSRRPIMPSSFPNIPKKQVRCRPTSSDYAVKIQKVFRGFRIRKNVSKIIEVKRAVDEVERDVMEGESVELIIRDDRHRLKVSETLMALLFKLDSVGGLNDAVRVCRKAVIRKAILLQERIDSLAAAADNELEAWECVDEEDNSRLLLEKMAEDNKRLMEMVTLLCNKNDNQTRLIHSLSCRVEQLEHAMNDKITRMD